MCCRPGPGRSRHGRRRWRAGSRYRLGSGELVDSMVHDGLFCAFDKLGMGAATETYTKLAQISREEQDAFSAMSHGRAAAAMKNGVFGGEITLGHPVGASGARIVLTLAHELRRRSGGTGAAGLCGGGGQADARWFR